MKHLLDTNICIYIIRRQPAAVFARFDALAPGSVGISSITYAELAYGVAKSARPAQNQLALQAFTAPLVVLPFDHAAAAAYGDVRAHLERKGTPIGPLDLQIAAHALSAGLVLVTNNTAEFRRVPKLRVENWVR
jgi:tRNA(fMet)-specific endonuclease VapC